MTNNMQFEKKTSRKQKTQGKNSDSRKKLSKTQAKTQLQQSSAFCTN